MSGAAMRILRGQYNWKFLPWSGACCGVILATFVGGAPVRTLLASDRFIKELCRVAQKKHPFVVFLFRVS